MKKRYAKKTEFVAATCPKCGGVLEIDSNFEVACFSNCKKPNT